MVLDCVKHSLTRHNKAVTNLQQNRKIHTEQLFTSCYAKENTIKYINKAVIVQTAEYIYAIFKHPVATLPPPSGESRFDILPMP